MNQVLIIISSRWCGAGEDGTSVNGGTVLEYGGVISSGAGAAGIAPERTRAAESVAIGAPCDDDNQDDDSKNHDDAELLSEASYDCNNDNALANQELASGYTRLQPNAGDIWWHVCNINDRTMSYHEAPHKYTTILIRFYWESQERSCRIFSCAQNGRRDTAGMKPRRFEECQCLASGLCHLSMRGTESMTAMHSTSRILL